VPRRCAALCLTFQHAQLRFCFGAQHCQSLACLMAVVVPHVCQTCLMYAGSYLSQCSRFRRSICPCPPTLVKILVLACFLHHQAYALAKQWIRQKIQLQKSKHPHSVGCWTSYLERRAVCRQRESDLICQGCQGTARWRALREVPQNAGQLEALGAWSRVTARKGRQVRSPDWGPKTSNANKENGEEGHGRWQVQCSR
jgi:hypothetical protein